MSMAEDVFDMRLASDGVYELVILCSTTSAEVEANPSTNKQAHAIQVHVLFTKARPVRSFSSGDVTRIRY